MEYVEGDSLATILKTRGRLPADEWRPWLDRLLDGLAYVHDQGYLHRDIKPDNIVVRTADGEPVLIDFGSARLASHERTHTQVLTPGYAPFEQHTSQGVQGPPTDIYALAAVSFRVLAGTPPPPAPDRMLNDRSEPLADRVAGATPEWLAAIDHALALRPEDRPQTVTAWLVTLHETSRMVPVEIEKLLEAASQGDAEALARLRADADAGNCEAQFALGEAQFALGEMYEWDSENEDGELVPADYAAAVAWYHKAADQGHAVAQFRLGVLYQNGVPVHEELAVTWYGRAASQGYPEAQYKLGQMYESGCGDSLLQDSEEAVAWFQKAASRGHVEAQFELGHMHSQGRGVSEDDETAVAWYRKAASQGHPGAQYYLGRMYDRGWSVRKDAAEAIAWYRKAAHQGGRVYSKAAKLALGEMYRTGNGVPKDRRQGRSDRAVRAATGQRTLFDGELYGSALAAMEALEGDMTASEIAEATRRAVTCRALKGLYEMGVALLHRGLFRLFIGFFARGRTLFGSFCAGTAPRTAPARLFRAASPA